jgi:glyoxylase-like metal-dependent hydrolase (beta-lactamase superfamily II)
VTEPNAVADRVEEIVPGVWRWTIPHDERIGGYETDAHAVLGDGGVVLIDPLPLEPAALARLGPVQAICLTAKCHQRSSWRLRRELGVPVYAPEGGPPYEEEPDSRYRAGDELAGAIRAVHTPGPEDAHHSFVLEREPRVLFCSDLLTNYEGRELNYVPLHYHDDPEATKRSVRGLLELDFAVLCFDHGSPIREDPHAAIRDLIARR